MNTDRPRSGTPFTVDPKRLSSDVGARVRRRFGVAAAETPDPAPDRAVILDHGAKREDLVDAMRSGALYVVERDETGDAHGDWLCVPVQTSGLFLSLTTEAAYGAQCAMIVCDELVRRGVFSSGRRPAVEFCLQEAVANAVVHGNLGIASTRKDHPEGHRQFSLLLTERLRDAVRRQRRIDLLARWRPSSLVVSVADQGEGFDEASLPAEANGDAHSGRGFLFMRELADEVTVTDGGRCTTLRFGLRPD